NFSGISTSYLFLNSTVTLPANAPTNLVFTGSNPTDLTASWTAPSPAGQTYILQVSTSQSDFANLSSSITAATSATIASLSVNTTYYGRVAAVVSGSTSIYSSPIVSTATLAVQPVTAASTWT